MATTVNKKRAQVIDVVHEPGNATRYTLIAVKARPSHWIVSVPYWGGAMEVTEGSCIHYEYVREKLGIRPKLKTLGNVDASEIAKMMATVVPHCEALCCTDENGNYTDEVRPFTPHAKKAA